MTQNNEKKKISDQESWLFISFYKINRENQFFKLVVIIINQEY